MTTPEPLSLFAQLMRASAAKCATPGDGRAAYPTWPVNPFPRGIREGSATDRVLAELRRVHPQCLENGQLRFNLGITRGMATWGLRFLESQGLVSRVPDPRHPHYARWRAVLPAPTSSGGDHE